LTRPTAAILLTGNELLRGVIADANTSFLARSLERHGLAMRRTITVGDGLDEISEGLRLALEGADLVVTSGGLGPTHDDRTVEAIARVAGVELVLDQDVLDRITKWTTRMAGRTGFPPERFEAGNRKQAHILAGSSVLGIAGTAPALVARVGDSQVVVLPGVPSELRRLWELAPAHPDLAGVFGRAQPRWRRLLRTYGIGESHVGDLFASLGGDPKGVETSICARNYEIEIDIRAEAGAEEAADGLAEGMRRLLGGYLFTEDERPVAEIVLDLLRERGWQMGTAESCTGGMIAAWLTAIPGSSDAFAGGVVSYANDVKAGLLGVPQEVLREHGAVSAETAAAMAAGARRQLGADVAVSVTGVAGPGGGTPDKPVGLVHLHLSSPEGEDARRLEFSGDRAGVRARAATSALHMARAHLVALPAVPPP
jgi:nicotinamide-nucleotide amidase